MCAGDIGWLGPLVEADLEQPERPIGSRHGRSRAWQGVSGGIIGPLRRAVENSRGPWIYTRKRSCVNPSNDLKESPLQDVLLEVHAFVEDADDLNVIASHPVKQEM